ncbi:MAG: SPFH domain-containing protein [Myxococcota bacterium]
MGLISVAPRGELIIFLDMFNVAFGGAAPPLFMSSTDFDALMAVLVAAGGVVLGFVVLIAVIRRFLFICGPNEILIFSGRTHRLPDGSTSNFKIVQGGRGFRIPFLEVVRRMDMRLFPVEVMVQNAYSAGGIPLTVRAIANVKLSADPVAVRNAIERFLDHHASQIAVAAQQTLEGVLREVVSQLTPEEVNEDRLKFAESLMKSAQDDFYQLGLELDVLKVQHVSDDQEYLNNLGRPRIAGMLRDAENAENAANQAVAEATAAARERAETATKQAQTRVVEAKNTAQAEMAQLDARSREAENQAEMAAETARARAEQQLQALRSELEKLRLHNDVVLPAEARRKAEELKARGEAAPAIENGKATAEALRLVSEKWAAAGEAGRDVYVLQQLQALAEAAADRVANSEVGQIKLVAGDDQAYSAVLSSYPAAVASVLRETGEALGLDLERLLAPVDHRSDKQNTNGRTRAGGGGGTTSASSRRKYEPSPPTQRMTTSRRTPSAGKEGAL